MMFEMMTICYRATLLGPLGMKTWVRDDIWGVCGRECKMSKYWRPVFMLNRLLIGARVQKWVFSDSVLGVFGSLIGS